jgi:hypothetical protein
MGEPPRSPHFERNMLNETLFFSPVLSPTNTQSLRESLARALSYYRTPSIFVSHSEAATDDLERGVWGTNIRISYKSVALSQVNSTCEKSEKRASHHVVIAPSPAKERRQVQRFTSRASYWTRFRIWFNAYRCVALLTTIHHAYTTPTSLPSSGDSLPPLSCLILSA